MSRLLPNSRLLFLLVFVFCALLMTTGYFMQYAMDMEPCPLCITQRFFIVLCGLISLIGALHNPGQKGRIGYGSLLALSALAGSGFSGRQLWLQSLPADQVPACGPGLAYMLETFPLSEALSILLSGDGNCAEVSWRFLGLSIPGWTLVCFAILIITGVVQARRAH
jgi:disulfide bond formation protein DsbB